MRVKNFCQVLSGIALAIGCSVTGAVPQLQLGIAGGTYDTASETIIGGSGTFDLYAFLSPGGDKAGGGNKDLALTDSVYISAALVPKTVSPGGAFGSIKINGITINVTGDMIFGTPPLDSLTTADGAALPGHDIFATYFYQTGGFNFDGATRYTSLNTQNDPDLSGLTEALDGAMYGRKFVIDVSGLDEKYAIHFDLYNAELAKCTGRDKDDCAPDYDAAAFAPFSHDAQSGPGGGDDDGGDDDEIPEPATLALMGLALSGLALSRRRARKH